MSKFHFTRSAESITVFVNGRLHTVRADQPSFKALDEHLKGEHDAATIESFVDKEKFVSRMTEGAVTVMANTVYFKGVPIHNTLAVKLVELLNAGYDAAPWAKFMDNIEQNPSANSKAQLFDFLEANNVPITEDGCFLVFKRVTKDYKDVYSQTFDNSIGAVVTMPREKVVDDPKRTCSAGLHVCALHYLSSGYGKTGVTVACKVNPMDVVSVPTDYNNSKIRCCKYEVIGDIDEEGSLNTETLTKTAVVTETGEVVKAKPTVVEKTQTTYDVNDFEILDFWPEEGGYAYDVAGNRVGLVVEALELEYNDYDHPEHDDWLNGLVAGEDIDNVHMFSIDFGDGDLTTFFLNWEDELVAAFPVDVEQVELDDEEDELYDVELDDAGSEGEMLTMEGAKPATGSTRFVPSQDADKIVELPKRNGGKLTMTVSNFLAEVQKHGQRGFDRINDVARTTVQDVLKRVGGD